MSTTALYVRGYLTDYVRNPVNLMLLVVVPVVFVVVVAGTMADAAKLLGGTGGLAVETATAGWAAAFLAGVAMYFQMASTRDTDRRLVVAGLPAQRLVLTRLLTGMTLAIAASVAALAALALRTGIHAPGRVVAGTLMFAVIYVAIGAVVGSLARNPVNGTVAVLFVWILDIFLGPAMGAADRIATRPLPTHYVTMWMVDLPGNHGGRLGDFGVAALWTVAAVASAVWLAARRLRIATPRHVNQRARPWRAQFGAATQAVWRDARRNRVQWLLFVVVPVVFILTADAVTPNKPITMFLREHGRTLIRALPMPDVHGATMAPIAIASLAALIGLFSMLDSTAGDRRAVLSGMRPRTMLTSRLGVLFGTTLAAAGVSLATTALIFDATSWSTYIGANVMIGLTYALVGALLAPIFGRVGGVFIAFLLPFLDLGIVQSPMLHAQPSTLSRLLPGYGSSRVLLDGALTRGFDETRPSIIAVAWFVALLIIVAGIYHRSVSAAAAVPPA